MSEEYKIEHTSREVIDKCLLTTLAEGNKVAIIATVEDLDLLEEALIRFLKSPMSATERTRAKELRDGIQILRKYFT